MPFEIAPHIIEAPARVGEFQDVADAMLRGCAISTPHRFSLWYSGEGKHGACAIGAYYLGMGLPFGTAPGPMAGPANEVSSAYFKKYGTVPAEDNDDGPYTREQIAARIAAL